MGTACVVSVSWVRVPDASPWCQNVDARSTRSSMDPRLFHIARTTVSVLGSSTVRRAEEKPVSQPAPSVASILSTLTKPRLVDLGRQFGVAIAKPNGVPITESVDHLVASKQLVFSELLEWMRRDELRKAWKKFGLDDRERSRGALAGTLLRAHGVQSVPPVSVFGEIGPQRSVPEPGDVALVRHRQYLVEAVAKPKDASELTRVDLVCLDDDQQGRALSVLWELELGAKVTDPHRGLESFRSIDPPRHFAAYLHA